MQYIVEERGCRYCSYIVSDEMGDSRVCRIRVCYEDEERRKPVVYSSDWSIILDATIFLREDFKFDADNTKKQAASAIKLFYSYLEIFGFSIQRLTRQQVKGFIEFIRGTLGDSSYCRVNLSRVRDESTVSDYLAVIRRFAKYLDLGDNHPLLKKKLRASERTGLRVSDYIATSSYEATVKTVRELMAPMCVSTPQYIALLNTDALRTNLRNRVIVRLMREHGLRIGEVLGLTLEDISTYIDENGMPRYCLEIRNRLSDSTDQRAKTAMKVRVKEDYRLPLYSAAFVGFEVVTLGFDVADELISYIEDAHALEHADRYWERREANAMADKVTDRLGAGGNYYVFLNTLGRPLTQNRWSQILRVIYTQADIPIDRVKKTKNLSHRLRHGYCMHLKHERGCDDYQVMVLMRHSSLESQKAYDNPTPEDILRLQERIVDGEV